MLRPSVRRVLAIYEKMDEEDFLHIEFDAYRMQPEDILTFCDDVAEIAQDIIEEEESDLVGEEMIHRIGLN